MNGGRYAQITGWGMAVPERVVTNDDLARMVDTNDEWIYSHTGIKQRHVVQGERETTAALAVRAGARSAAGGRFHAESNRPGDRRNRYPGVHVSFDGFLRSGCHRCPKAGAFDLSAGCSGFLYGLSIASHIIRNGGRRSHPGDRLRNAVENRRLDRSQHLRVVRRRGRCSHPQRLCLALRRDGCRRGQRRLWG